MNNVSACCFTCCMEIGSVNVYVHVSQRSLTLLHSEWPKLHRVLAILSAKGLTVYIEKNS